VHTHTHTHTTLAFNKRVYLLALLAMNYLFSMAQIEMLSNGRVAVGNYFGGALDYNLEVRGDMYVDHQSSSLPPGGGNDMRGVYFTHHSYQFQGNTVYRSILQPQWNNNYWIGNATNRYWRVYAAEVYADNLMYTSDERRKENFKELTSSLSRLMTLQPYTFDYKFVYDEKRDEISNAEIEEGTKNHVGFKAQDLIAEFPYLVKYDENEDLYSVNYVGFIPELVSAIKEQQEVIDETAAQVAQLQLTITELREQLESIQGNCCDATNLNQLEQSGIENLNVEGSTPYLEQNVPNPFNRETQIGYYLTEQTNDAHIYVYNMNGQQIAHFSLTQKGKNSITIGKNKLPAGMYFYTLIVDGQEISTKKMILTD
jgi:uncharacterized coiled-coil protein SlyX